MELSTLNSNALLSNKHCPKVFVRPFCNLGGVSVDLNAVKSWSAYE